MLSATPNVTFTLGVAAYYVTLHYCSKNSNEINYQLGVCTGIFYKQGQKSTRWSVRRTMCHDPNVQTTIDAAVA